MHMPRLIFAALLAATTCAAQAQKGESVMFGDTATPLLQPDAAADHGERCEALRREVDALKGKPQRRMTAMQRYEAECQGTAVPSSPQPGKP